MLTAMLIALVAFVTSGPAANAQADNVGIQNGAPRRADTLDYIRLDVKDKPLHDVLQGISRQVDINIIADPGIEESVTVQLSSVEWRKALEIIARETHCTIIHESPRLIRFAQPTSVTMEFQDANLKFVLEILAKQSGANIVIADNVKGTVTLALQGVPWRQALETVVNTAGYVTVEDNENILPIIRVVHPDSLKKQLETRIMHLRYIRPREKYNAIIKGIEEVSRDTQGNEVVDAEADFTLLRALKKALSPDGDMDYDKVTNTLVVKDVKPSLEAIEKMVAELDKKPPLVQVDVKFISTSSADVLETGIKFDLPNTPQREGLRLNLFGPDPEPLTTSREVFQGFLDPAIENGGTYPFDIGHWDSLGGFNPRAILDFTETRLLLSMVRDDDNSKIIQEPTLTTTDNKDSTIFVGESVPFAVQRVSQDQNGNITVEIDENERSPVNIGFTLYISPHVITGTDTIDMTVIPKVSSLTGTTSIIDGFERFSFSVDENNQLLTFIDLPRESQQTVVTYLRVQAGHTAVIGGLHSEKKFEIETRIPILSSLPILGSLFKWKRKATNVDHLLILITPRILSGIEASDANTKLRIEEAERYDYFAHKYGTATVTPEQDLEHEVPVEDESKEKAKPESTKADDGGDGGNK